MPAAKPPDPLEPGHIEGQNPNTPQRLPGATGAAGSALPGDANEEELGGRPAFLFTSGGMAGVTLDSSGQNLPPSESGEPWTLDRYFTLGVRDVGLLDVNPEPILTGVVRQGYYVWHSQAPHRRQDVIGRENSGAKRNKEP